MLLGAILGSLGVILVSFWGLLMPLGLFWQRWGLLMPLGLIWQRLPWLKLPQDTNRQASELGGGGIPPLGGFQLNKKLDDVEHAGT